MVLASALLLLGCPVIIAIGAFVLARRLQRLRWLIHILALTAMIVVGPLVYVGMLDASAGPDIGPGAGLIFLLFVPIVVVTFLFYLQAVFFFSRTARPQAQQSAP